MKNNKENNVIGLSKQSQSKLIMSSQKQQSYWVQTEALHRYVTSLFPESLLPTLPKFLDFKSYQQPQSKGATLTLIPGTDLSLDEQSLLQAESIMYLHLGVIELYKAKGKQKELEYKQGFFTLVNYKMMNSPEPQKYRMVTKTKAVVSIFKMKKGYGFEWLSKNWYKNQLLGKALYLNDSGMEIERKKKRFKEFIQQFKLETIRRDTRFMAEGSKNQKIYILGHGEAKIMKDMKVRDDKGNIITRTVTILYLPEGSVLGGELFLMASKPVHQIITSLSATYSIHEENEEEEEDKKDEKKKQQKGKHKPGKVTVEEGGYVLYSPHQNINNYSVVVQSANLELYSVGIEPLIESISERQKINLTKLLEQSYITILRRTHEKLNSQRKKQQQKMAQTNHTLNLMTSHLYSNSSKKYEQKEGISIRKSQMGTNQNLNQLKRNEVSYGTRKKLEKKADLLITTKTTQTDFKQKIETLLEQKLGKYEIHNQKTQEQVAYELAQIFGKNNEGRTEDIELHSSLLDKKIALLDKRGGWQDGWDLLKEYGISTENRPKSEAPHNYLTHSSPEHLTFKVKEECAVKIHEANKIKEQFMKIKSECRSCSCYQNFEKFNPRRSLSTFTRTAYRSTDGWGRATTKMSGEEKPLEMVYNEMKFLSQKSKQKYNHNMHLIKVRRNKDKLERRKSAPILPLQ